jgi:hypothetical protein
MCNSGNYFNYMKQPYYMGQPNEGGWVGRNSYITKEGGVGSIRRRLSNQVKTYILSLGFP